MDVVFPRDAVSEGALDDAFDEAAGNVDDVVDARFRIAGRLVVVAYAGIRLFERLGRAFAHLAVEDDSEPALRLRVWESGPEAATFGDPGAVDHGTPSSTVRDDPGPSYFSDEGGIRILHQPKPGLVSALTDDARRGWFSVPDVDALPSWDYAAPYRHLLSWWLASFGVQQVHAGAVGLGDDGLLVVGRGGSGKSTVALTSLADDRLSYAGDDYVAIGSEPGGRMIYSLYSSGKVHRPNLVRLPHVAKRLANPDRMDEKAIVFVDDAFPGRSVAALRLRAIVVPRVAGESTTRIAEISSAAALTALAPSSVFQLHPPDKHTFGRIARLTRDVPAFRLELGTDVHAIPDRLVDVLSAAR